MLSYWLFNLSAVNLFPFSNLVLLKVNWNVKLWYDAWILSTSLLKIPSYLVSILLPSLWLEWLQITVWKWLTSSSLLILLEWSYNGTYQDNQIRVVHIRQTRIQMYLCTRCTPQKENDSHLDKMLLLFTFNKYL